jgi:autotransporter adhesin
VNGSQLSTTNSTVAGLGNSLSTTNSSLTGLGSNLSSLSTSLAGGTTGRVQATGTTNQLALVEPGMTGAAPGAAQQLTNVAAGRAVANGTDAVNGGQLFETNRELSTTNSNVAGLNNSLSTVNSNVAGLGSGLSTTNSSLSALAASPLTFKGNSGEVARRLGDTLAIRGDETTAGTYSGANLRTMIDAATGAVNLQMAQSPVFDAVAMPNGTRLDGTGLSINGGPKVTTDGIDAGGKRISNVGAGTADGDVANFGQVKQAIQNANAPVGTGGHLVQYDDPDEDGITLGDSTSTNGGATGGTKLTNLAQGALTANSTDAVNGSQLSTTNSNVDGLRNSLSTTNTSVAGLNSSLSTLAVNPLTFKGNSGEVARKLGDTLSISGAATTAGTYSGANLKTVVDATTGAVNLQMAQAPVFDSVAMPNGTKLDGAGLTISGGPKVTTDGIDAGGKKIGNVGAGTADGDVANFGQVKDAIATANAAAGTAANAVQYDDATKTGVRLGGADSSAAVKLSNVADGTNGNDAVNFAQLSNLGNGVAGALGGTYAGGVYQAPTFTTIGGSATTVQGALTNLGNAVTQGTAGPVQTAGMPNQLVLVETGKTGAAPGAAQSLTNLASGTVAKDSKDAVNGGQLFTLQEDIKSLNGNAIKFDGADKARATLGGTTSTDGGLTNGTRLSNVAQGAVGQGSTDAVNGAQLHATNTAVADHAANTSAYLGGGADVAAGKAPAYAVQGGSFNNVGAALGAVDQNLSTLNSTVSTLGAATQNAVQYDGKDKGGITLGGAKSTDGGATNGTKIGNVAQGNVSATSTDAINGAQLAAANRTVSDFIGGGADATTGKAPAFAVQGNTSGTVGGAISAIDGNLSTINNAINGGGIKYVRVNSSQPDATASGQNAVALGAKAVASEADTVAVGGGATAERAQGTAIGFNALVQQTGGVALGAGSVASTAAGIAGYVPAGASAQDTAAIKATTSTQAAVSVGNAANGQFRQITGVAAGTADSDAANVAQVRASVGEARAGSTQYDRHADGTTNYGQITLGNGQAPDGTRISNVAPGVQGTDAVNVNQLAGATAASANYTDARVNAVKNRVEQVARDAYAGVASAMAVQMPGSSIPGKTVMRMGAANFKGQSAVGISFRRTAMNNGWSMTGGVGVSRAGAAMTVGAEWVFE